MAEFRGFECDACKGVIATDTRTKMTVRFEGPVSGEAKKDLCLACAQEVSEEVDLKPLRTRKPSTPSEGELNLPTEAGKEDSISTDTPVNAG